MGSLEKTEGHKEIFSREEVVAVLTNSYKTAIEIKEIVATALAKIGDLSHYDDRVLRPNELEHIRIIAREEGNTSGTIACLSDLARALGISEPELSGSSEKDSKLAEQTFHRNKIIEAFAPLLRDTKERKAESDSSYYIAEYLNRKKLSASMVRNFMSIESNRGAAVEGDNILQKLADRLGIKQSELPQ